MQAMNNFKVFNGLQKEIRNEIEWLTDVIEDDDFDKSSWYHEIDFLDRLQLSIQRMYNYGLIDDSTWGNCLETMNDYMDLLIKKYSELFTYVENEESED